MDSDVNRPAITGQAEDAVGTHNSAVSRDHHEPPSTATSSADARTSREEAEKEGEGSVVFDVPRDASDSPTKNGAVESEKMTASAGALGDAAADEGTTAPKRTRTSEGEADSVSSESPHGPLHQRKRARTEAEAPDAAEIDHRDNNNDAKRESAAINAAHIFDHDRFDRLRLRLYSLGNEVHAGAGPEALFSEYWSAIKLQLSGNLVLDRIEMGRCRSAIKTFLKTKQMRKIHNAIVTGLMKRAIVRDSIISDVSMRQIPTRWRPRVLSGGAQHDAKKGQPPQPSTDLQKRRQRKAATPAPCDHTFPPNLPLFLSNNRIDEVLPFAKSSRVVEPSDLGSTHTPSPTIPAALVVDPKVRKIADESGLKASEDSVWLMSVAVKEYIVSTLRTVIDSKKLQEQGKVATHGPQYPRVLSMSIDDKETKKPASKSSKKSTSSKKQTKATKGSPSTKKSKAATMKAEPPPAIPKLSADGKKKLITASDMLFLPLAPSTGNLGGSLSWLSCENIVHGAGGSNVIGGPGSSLSELTSFITSSILAEGEKLANAPPPPEVPPEIETDAGIKDTEQVAVSEPPTVSEGAESTPVLPQPQTSETQPESTSPKKESPEPESEMTTTPDPPIQDTQDTKPPRRSANTAQSRTTEETSKPKPEKTTVISPPPANSSEDSQKTTTTTNDQKQQTQPSSPAATNEPQSNPLGDPPRPTIQSRKAASNPTPAPKPVLAQPATEQDPDGATPSGAGPAPVIRGMGRGAKNLAAMRARTSPAPGDDPDASPENSDTKLPRPPAPSPPSKEIVAMDADATDDQPDQSAASALEINLHESQDMQGLAGRRGKGTGTKNLRAMLARSSSSPGAATPKSHQSDSKNAGAHDSNASKPNADSDERSPTSAKAPTVDAASKSQGAPRQAIKSNTNSEHKETIDITSSDGEGDDKNIHTRKPTAGGTAAVPRKDGFNYIRNPPMEKGSGMNGLTAPVFAGGIIGTTPPHVATQGMPLSGSRFNAQPANAKRTAQTSNAALTIETNQNHRKEFRRPKGSPIAGSSAEPIDIDASDNEGKPVTNRSDHNPSETAPSSNVPGDLKLQHKHSAIRAAGENG